jgi:hypothetical protein
MCNLVNWWNIPLQVIKFTWHLKLRTSALFMYLEAKFHISRHIALNVTFTGFALLSYTFGHLKKN